MMIPVLLILPPSPMLLELAVRDVPFTGCVAIVIVTHVEEDSRHGSRSDMRPRPPEVPCAVPVTIIGTIPIPIVKEDVGADCRGGIHIRARDDDDRRRCRDDERRRRRNHHRWRGVDPYA